jgi:hypothetical protein
MYYMYLSHKTSIKLYKNIGWQLSKFKRTQTRRFQPKPASLSSAKANAAGFSAGSLIAAPSSTKNKDKARDPEVHQT